jgi:hypothetical protein
VSDPLDLTGPPYPLTARTGGAIGSFIIGFSPIGGFETFQFWKTVLSQYANSSILTQLIENFDECVDQTINFDAFYALIWNVDTAQGYGLDVWGRIVGVTRVLTIDAGVFFGMTGPGGASGDSYDGAPFFAGASSTTNFNLTDDAFRLLIFAKALANICDGSIKAINQLLLNLFPGLGDVSVQDNLDMTMTINFAFVLTEVQFAIVANSGVLPVPTGVSFTVVVPP